MKRIVAACMSALMLLGALSGCGNKKTAALEDPNKVSDIPYEIQWYLMADAQDDVASVEESLNEYLKDKINATVKINCLPSAQYTQKLGTMINAGEYFDMAFVARWALDYIGNSRNGAFFDLTDHLDTYLKDMTETIGRDNLKYSYVDGRLYAMPVYKEMATQYGWIYRKDIAEKYNIDMTKYRSFEALEPVLKMVQQNEPDMKYPIDWAYGAGDPSCLYPAAQYIFMDGSYDNKAVNIYATKEYKQAYETARDFYKKGYIRPDVLTATDQVARMSEGKTFVMLQPIKPGKEKELFKDSKYEFAQADVDENPRMDYLAGTGSMTAISATSKNPARVMKFLNILNTDPYVKNLVVHGIEGKHYTKIDDKTVEPIPGSGYNLYADTWSIGNVYLDYLTKEDDPQKHEKLKAYMDRAETSEVGAFLMKKVTDPNKKQRGIEVSNAVSNYAKQLAVGAVDVEPTLTEFNNMLKKAGMDEMLDDINKEYAEYLKTQKE